MISATVLVKNGERRLSQVLSSLRNFSEIVVLDTGSTDTTLSIARQFPNVSIYQEEFRGFGEMHARAAALAKHDWILSIDADEELSPELAKEILTCPLDEDCVYSLPFHNYFNGKLIKGCGWYPESHVRLFHRQKTNFTLAKVHEGVITERQRIVPLTHPVLHVSYDSISDFLVKMERYTTLFAEEHRGKKRSSPLKALLHGTGAFLKSYVLKRGCFDGYEGLLISAYNGHTAFYKYMKLYATQFDVPQGREREAHKLP